MLKLVLKIAIVLFFALNIVSFPVIGNDSIKNKINEYVEKTMKDADIPGLSIVLISGEEQIVLNYGYANLETNEKVTNKTLFQIGSCSKAFTALAIAKLEHQKKLSFDDNVSDYLPWFRVLYKDKPVRITIRQLLHHTSGIPWSTISKIPQSNETDALEKTIVCLVDQKLNNLPGKKFEYATINYDILALIIQQLTNQSFESYVQENIFQKLNFNKTSIGEPLDKKLLAKGYKIGFFEPREYEAPVFKGNNAAGYVVSNAEDISKWLSLQIGLANSDLFNLTKLTQQRDETVPPHDLASYGMGWEVSLNGKGDIYHGGDNPNYTSYFALRPQQKIGIAVLANSNSSFTKVIGGNVMKLMAGEEITRDFLPEDKIDKTCSILALIIVGYILIVAVFLCKVFYDVHKGRRKFEGFDFSKLAEFALALFVVVPFLYGGYVLPGAMLGFTWESLLVWTPISFPVLAVIILTSIAISYFTYFITLCFPEPNQYRKIAPRILLMSILSGVSNMVIIILITSSLNSMVELKYLVFYYMLTFSLYIVGRRFVQINLIKFSRGLIYELRIKLIDKIFSTSYQNFERIDRGRVYTALNEDVGTIGESSNMFVGLITNFFTATAAFLYLASIAFWATLLTMLLIGTISVIYYFVSKSTKKYFEEARDTRNVFMRLTNGMIDGFKELSLHRVKKLEYKKDVALSAREYKDKISTAQIRFVNAFIVGESLLIVLLGIVSFAIPKLFPNIALYTIMSFVIVLLYLIGPINGLLGSVPAIMQLRIAWNRIQNFLKEIPGNLNLNEAAAPIDARVKSIKARDVRFQYQNSNEHEAFEVGPINLEVQNGEILFIIGGNGSGKTTFAKLLTGLYKPDKGELLINNKVVSPSELSEYYSTVFSPSHLFEKLYNIDTKDKSDDIEKYLKILNLEDKVTIKENQYSTIQLSGGQRKRLALLQCYLEDSPIYLFDEWAADQDPTYRQFFYRTLLPEMRRLGKIVIAITHDDHYFDVADHVMMMNHGQLNPYFKNNNSITAGFQEAKADIHELVF